MNNGTCTSKNTITGNYQEFKALEVDFGWRISALSHSHTVLLDICHALIPANAGVLEIKSSHQEQKLKFYHKPTMLACSSHLKRQMLMTGSSPDYPDLHDLSAHAIM